LLKAGLSVFHADSSGARIAIGSATRRFGSSPRRREAPAANIENTNETPLTTVPLADLTLYKPPAEGLTPARQRSELAIVIRIARFVAVGAMCYFIQLGFLHLLMSLMAVYIADIVAFMLSAQVNFSLSQLFTWGDRQTVERLSMRWLKFNLNALLSVTIVNAGILWMLVSVGLHLWSAMLLANCATACWTFAVNHLLVFKGKPNSTSKSKEFLK
jgi:putative flippase GtrA